MMNLSVIIPIHNEAKNLPGFLEMFSRQRDIEPELVFVDGDSADDSVDLLRNIQPGYRWPVRIVQTGKGRARQLNAGADAAQGDWFLFLHIDSEFRDEKAVYNALAELQDAADTLHTHRIAGHFRLKFRRSRQENSFGYYFWEAKTRLDRPECTHGDQGFLIKRKFYREIGPFDTDVPIAEDTRLAERIREEGSWCLLPAEIWTSARRFEVEGLAERQLLNALIMNFAAIGWKEFFCQARDVYRTHDHSSRLDLRPFFALVDRLNDQTPFLQRLRRWYRTGRYVRLNAWQLAFLRDVKRGYSLRVPVDALETPRLDLHDRWFDRVTDNFAGRVVAMLGTWCWYRLTVRRYNKASNK